MTPLKKIMLTESKKCLHNTYKLQTSHHDGVTLLKSFRKAILEKSCRHESQIDKNSTYFKNETFEKSNVTGKHKTPDRNNKNAVVTIDVLR